MSKILFILIVLIAALTPFAQSPANTKPTAQEKANGDSVEVITLKLNSKLMGREMPYRILYPKGYAQALETRYGVIYLLHGLTGHFDNWTDKTEIEQYAARHKFIIVTPEGANGWYTDSIAAANDKYESYIIKELVPEVDTKFRTLANRDNRIIAGLSMGGYGAIKFGFKYPEMFSLVGSFSGALGAASFYEKNVGASLGRGIEKIFGLEGSETRRSNDIFGFVRELTGEKLKTLPYIYQSCGTEDFLFDNNREFLALLIEKKVPHEYRETPGGHTWVFWNDQVREFLDVAARRSKK